MKSTPAPARTRPFDRAFRWLLLITVFWSFNALAATGELPVLVALGGYPLLLLAWLGERHYPLGKWTWRFLTFAAILFLGWYFEARARTDAIVYLLLFLLVNKLWMPKRPRDILQIYVICFFFMLSASILTMSMLFMFFFVGFVFLIVVGMAFLTVQREHETLAALGADRRAGINPEVNIPANFFMRAWGLVLLIFFFTFWIFALFPRFTEQQLLPTMSGFAGPARTGFSNDIRLGSSNRIEMDPTVVMRVMLQRHDSIPQMNELYLRGAVLERYDNGHWEADPEAHRVEREGRYAGNYHNLQQMIPPGDYSQVRQLVYLNPTVNGNLFMLENAAQLRVMLGRYLLEHDVPANTVRVLAPQQNRVIQYSVISYVPNSKLRGAASQPTRGHRGSPVSMSAPRRPDVDLTKSAEEIGKAFHESFGRGVQETASLAKRLGSAAAFREAYLQLPRSSRQNQIASLAGSIVTAAGATTAEEKASAIERYLQRNYGYTLDDLSFGRREPTEAFLLDEKKGHCEYFASAMALMLRHVGVPSRIVNGYFTDRWNDLGDYFQVEKSDAHSWVEAFLDESGWTSFDPSPPGDITRTALTSGWMSRLRFWSDAIKMKWQMYVIDYDLRDQGDLLQSLNENVPQRGGPIGRWLGRGTRMLTGDTSPREFVGKAIVGVALAIVAAAFGMGMFFVTRIIGRRRGTSRRLQTLLQRRRVMLYEKILKELERKGLRRAEASTPLEFARHVETVRPDLGGFVALTRQYYEVRYAERTIDDHDVAAFTSFLKRAKSQPATQQLRHA